LKVVGGPLAVFFVRHSSELKVTLLVYL
jgi:hypothetical protein